MRETFSRVGLDIVSTAHYGMALMDPGSTTGETRLRILIAKLGLDGHDRGAKIVARTLRDAGMEVIYTGLHRTPNEVAVAAVQEDVDVIGISLLSGAHLTLVPRVLALLKATEANDIPLVVGGVFPDEDIPEMKAMGVAEVLSQDTSPEEIVRTIRHVAAVRPSRSIVR